MRTLGAMVPPAAIDDHVGTQLSQRAAVRLHLADAVVLLDVPGERGVSVV
jgi:hypothetical protein